MTLTTPPSGASTVSAWDANGNLLTESTGYWGAHMLSKSTVVRAMLTLVLALLLIIAWPVGALLWKTHLGAEQTECSQNLSQLARAVLIYAEDWDERLPGRTTWATNIATPRYIDGGRPATTSQLQSAAVFHCPAAHQAHGYMMNSAVAGHDLSDVDRGYLVLLFETDSSAFNASGGPSDIAAVRHGMLNVAFATGSVHWQNLYVVNHWRWTP